ncbi:MAG: MerR family transcriptional regulator [Verrucomicrobiae bacterium]|nr:MerR family transcriptional regulator [Verrucomicrobiae bacterium]
MLKHSIKVVARRTGLSPHVIRVWEKRYGTVRPQRSGGNQRLYSEDDVQRLSLLKQATDAGHSIGNITHLHVADLHTLLLSAPAPVPAEASDLRRLTAHAPPRDATALIESAHTAVAAMDAAALERVLEEGSVALGQTALLAQVVAPLVQRIGDGWRDGSLKVAHEHLASAVIRTFLGHAARPIALHASAPVLVATTPAGQLHELGAALAAAAARSQGWRVVYMGASLPAEEIVSTAQHHEARAVALSIVHPADDPLLPDELRRLRRLLDPAVRLVVGGRAVDAYRPALREINATVCETLGEFFAALDRLRQNANGPGRVATIR